MDSARTYHSLAMVSEMRDKSAKRGIIAKGKLRPLMAEIFIHGKFQATLEKRGASRNLNYEQ